MILYRCRALWATLGIRVRRSLPIGVAAGLVGLVGERWAVMAIPSGLLDRRRRAVGLLAVVIRANAVRVRLPEAGVQLDEVRPQIVDGFLEMTYAVGDLRGRGCIEVESAVRCADHEHPGALNAAEDAGVLEVLDGALDGAQRRVVPLDELAVRRDPRVNGGLAGPNAVGDVDSDSLPAGIRVGHPHILTYLRS